MRDSARVDRRHTNLGHDINEFLLRSTAARLRRRSDLACFRAGTGLANSPQEASGVRRLKLTPGPLAKRSGEGDPG